MTATLDEILAALPCGDLVASIQSCEGHWHAKDVPIKRPEPVFDPRAGYALWTFKIVFDDGSDREGNWPIETVESRGHALALIGPKGVAFIAGEGESTERSGTEPGAGARPSDGRRPDHCVVLSLQSDATAGR